VPIISTSAAGGAAETKTASGGGTTHAANNVNEVVTANIKTRFVSFFMNISLYP
jgi:hypothetical protein